MASKNKRAIYPIHPGTVLAGELVELGMSVADLACTLRVPDSRIHHLVSGRCAMTTDTALRLQQWLGVSAVFWMSLQRQYELDFVAEAGDGKIQRTVERRSPQDRAS